MANARRSWNCALTDMQTVGASIAVRCDGHWLLIRRGKEPYRGCWSLPGGRMEKDERPAETAKRELLEETGVAIDENVIRFLTHNPLKQPGMQIAVHTATFAKPRPDATAGDDADDARWFSDHDIEALTDENVTPHLRAVLKMAANDLTKA